MSRKTLIGIVAACIIVVIVPLVISLSGCGPVGDQEVTFPDPNLDTVIRVALNKSSEPIHASELASLVSLDASHKGIEDLSGLQYCTSLAELNLLSNEISDISPLANLTSLTELYFMFNEVSDISPLASLTGLTRLGLDLNRVIDISPLANLTSLTLLSLYGNQISDISPLTDLITLTWLNLGSNRIGDISPLANLTSLIQLSLGSNQIGDISPLAGLTSLAQLYLMYNQISDISPLVDNDGLSDGDIVHLQGNPLSPDSTNIYIPQLEARGVNVEYLSLLAPAIGAIGVPITNIDFAWTDVTGADEYDWVLSPNPDLSSPVAVKIGLISAACTYSGTALAYDTFYYWQVAAYKEGAFINQSSIGTFTTIPAPP